LVWKNPVLDGSIFDYSYGASFSDQQFPRDKKIALNCGF